MCLNLAHQAINGALRKKAGSHPAHRTCLQRVKRALFSRPDGSHSFQSRCTLHAELSLSLLHQTSGGADPGKINMPLDDFKCGCFLLLWGYKGPSITAVCPPSLTDAEPLNYMIKGCHRESMKAARPCRFSSGCRLTASS